MSINIVFMGSPDFALPSLSGLADHWNVVGVVTQPDRPAGRGRVLTPPPVKKLADERGIPVIQPEKLRQPEAWAQLQSWNPDLIVVTAFGQILRQNVLSLPRYGCINVHASLLPRWRGAAPIQAALLHGDPVSGVTVMKMDAGIDTGDIFCQREYVIQENDTAESLGQTLAQMGADLLVDSLPDILAGKIISHPQDADHATYAGMIRKEDGILDFSRRAEELVWKVRAYTPWPGAVFTWQNESLKVLRAAVGKKVLPTGEHGQENGFPTVGCGEDSLVLLDVQPAGKKPMSGDIFLRGARRWLE